MRFKRVTFSLLSPLIGFHYGRNPVSGQRFLHVAPFPFFGLDFEFKPYISYREIKAADRALSPMYEEALRAIRGPFDDPNGLDWRMIAYREAGGGYEGLQAIASAALDTADEWEEIS
jgi:hypothetical protein